MSRAADAMDQRESLHALRAPSLPCCPRHRLLYACHKADGQSAWARANGIAATEVTAVLGGRREAGDAMLDALGLERVTAYREKRT